MNEPLTMKEASEILQISARKIHRYCNSGLVPAVRRNSRRHRVFEPWQLDHIRIIANMEKSGFNKSDLKRYTRLVRQGDSTIPERKAILLTRKRQLWQEIADRQAAIDFIERTEEDFESAK